MPFGSWVRMSEMSLMCSCLSLKEILDRWVTLVKPALMFALDFPEVFRAALLTISLKAFQCLAILSSGFSTSLLRAVSIQDLKVSAHSQCFNFMVFSFWGGLAAFSLHGGSIDRQSCNHTIWLSVEHSAPCFTLVIWMSKMSLCWVMT